METSKIELEIPIIGENKLYFYDEVTTDTTKDFIKSFHKLSHELDVIDNKNKQALRNLYISNIDLPSTDIHIHLDTVGGYCHEGLLIFDIIRTYTKRHVYIFSEGFVASMGIVLLCSVPVEYRYATENTTFMIHSISGGTDFGRINDLKDSVQIMERLQKNIWNIIANNTNIPMQRLIENQEKREDWFLTAEEALECGLISKIIKNG